MADDPIRPGALTTRAKMKEVFGGGQGQGIQPSARTPNVLIYTDPASGEKSGFYDGWIPEEEESEHIFEYTGDGEGDQVFTGPYGVRNKAILTHVDDGRDLRVFKACGKVPGSGAKLQRYIGKFELDPKQPYVPRQAPNQQGVMRNVIVFRLRPIDALPPSPEDTITALSKTEVVSVPPDITKSALIEPEMHNGKPISRSAVPRTSVRRNEASLCQEFQKLLEEHEHRVARFQIRVAGLSSSLLTDLYDTNSHVLYEAKGTSTRESVRMAIGQLMDYRRHITPTDPTLAVLLPRRPHDDLVDLLDSINVNLVYQHQGSFVGWPVNAHASH
ncbi:hypothetical protein [Nocardiopsis sp. CNT312]|uniref:hypothetical protein n=1 Tax=Nocardiopsis sp. CNT312 TaxID=1137268 RepID=UPI0012DFCAE4|nr:hypothetical protein [Nocardiopsis sp. CNT312]